MKIPSCTTIVLAVMFAVTTPCRAQSIGQFGSAVEDYLINWFPRVTQIQSEQPHWVTPLVTVTPRLEEEVRYDQLWQANPHGVATDNFGAGKGLELIPFQNTEIILGVPAWIAHNGHILHGKDVDKDDWADETFLVKYRLLSANEENGNYILTGLHGLQRADRQPWKQFRALSFHADDRGGQRHWRFRCAIDGGDHVSERRRRSARMAARVEYRFPVSNL
jgi:hypothetical protein